MLQPGVLTRAFQTYWEDMEKCGTAKAFWSLLHVTVCLPDICSALESQNGNSEPRHYKDWCNRFLGHAMLNADERYQIRCKLLHQGRAIQNKGRYKRFSFGQPAPTGEVDHMRVEGTHPDCTLHLDAGELAKEMKSATESWIVDIENTPAATKTTNVERNLQSLVKVTLYSLPPLSPTAIASQIYKRAKKIKMHD